MKKGKEKEESLKIIQCDFKQLFQKGRTGQRKRKRRNPETVRPQGQETGWEKKGRGSSS